jgi:uroporphyrinogen decarboxylase
MSVLDDLVSTGIDALNPIEIAAGMDIRRIHKRHPRLILVGGVDVSQLLLYGTPLKIKTTIRKAIEDSEGMIMVGSSTELGNDVPLRNFLTMYETIDEYRY